MREARGAVLEIAVGTGRNLDRYAAGTTVTGIELSEAMLERARARAARLGADVELRQGDAQRLPFPAASFDTVVCTFALCTIPDDRLALRESRRVLRHDGLLLLVEHVRSRNPAVRLLQRLAEPLMHRLGGDHLLRDPVDHLAEAGFVVERVERSRLGVLERVRARAV